MERSEGGAVRVLTACNDVRSGPRMVSARGCRVRSSDGGRPNFLPDYLNNILLLHPMDLDLKSTSGHKELQKGQQQKSNSNRL